jgi:hypothetical protein
MKKRYLFFTLIVLLAMGTGIAVRAVLTRVPQHKIAPYTIVWQTTEYDRQGKATPISTETRYVASNGNWRSIRYYGDGRKDETFAEVGRGVFAVGRDKLYFLSEHSIPSMEVTLEGFKSAPGYVRTEMVMGLLTVVQHPANDLEGRIDGYRALSLGGELVKWVSRDATVTTVQEPVNIVLGEPASDLLTTPKGLPIDTSDFNKLHGPPPNELK